MYVPECVLAAAGAASSAAFAGACARVQLLGLEGPAAEEFLGAELEAEVLCGQACGGEGNPEGPKRSTALRVAPSSTGGGFVQLAPTAGAAPLDFELAACRGRDGGTLRCRLKLWNKSSSGARRGGRLLGDVCFGVPMRAAVGALALSDGRLSARVDARWEGLSRGARLCLADHLGRRGVAAAGRRRWSELAHVAGLAIGGGWGDDTLACSKMTLGKVDGGGHTALRLCVVPGPGAEGPAAAAQALLQSRADPHALAADGDSPLTAALRVGAPFAQAVVPYARPSLARGVGLAPAPPWLRGPVEWEALRTSRAFDLILAAAEQRRRWVGPGEEVARSGALCDTLCHAVSRRFLAMSARACAASPPLQGKASAAEGLLLEKMLRLARADGRWFSVAEAQLKRGATVGVQAWRGGQQVLLQLADLAAKGQPHAQQMLLEAALGPGWERSCDEPRMLFPEAASECAVCFEPLYKNEPAYFRCADGSRACVHYVCGGCAAEVVPSKECPMCRAEVVDFAPLPHLEVDPRGWFAAASGGHDSLEESALIHALVACLPVNEEQLRSSIAREDGLWRGGWGRNRDGLITEEEFFRPDCGLFAWILAHLQELHRAERRGSNTVPDLRADPGAWFAFWDDEGCGCLGVNEVLRGVYGSRQLSALGDSNDIKGVRNEVIGLWRRVGLSVERPVPKAEFLRPGGLGAMLAAAFDKAGVPMGEVPLAAMPVPPPSPPPARFREPAPAPAPAAALPPPSPGGASRRPNAPADAGRDLFAAAIAVPPPSSPPAPHAAALPWEAAAPAPPWETAAPAPPWETAAPAPPWEAAPSPRPWPRPSPPEAKDEAPDSAELQMLLAMGFPRDASSAALGRAKGNVEQAVAYLLQGAGGGGAGGERPRRDCGPGRQRR